MGRSRRVTTPADGDQSNKSKRRKTTIPNVETLTTITSSGGKDVSEEAKGSGGGGGCSGGGSVALYHCNYCSKDVSGSVRIKCAVCPDFDLCIECFSVGAELTPHKCNHPYRVMDNLSFPLICPDWNADEEILLLEGIEMYGFGNWTEVSEHVGTKNKFQCIDHYNAIYMNSPCFPVPDMSLVMGKSREELLEMAKGREVKKEFCRPEEHAMKEEPVSTPGFKCIGPRKEGLPSLLSTGNTGAVINASAEVQSKDCIKVEELQSDRSVGEKKPRVSGDVGPSVTELSGYNFKRQEFEVEYDNDAEHLLADMEFKDTDTEAEYELKLRVLRIYSKRLDERKRRKDFILERNLLYPDPFEKTLSIDEKEIYQRYKVFMRFHSKEDHEELMKSIIEEYRMVKRLQDLQEARAAGCQMAAEANLFIENKRMKEAEKIPQRVRDSVQAGSSGKAQLLNHDISPRSVVRGPAGMQPFSWELSSSIVREAMDSWDVSGFPGANLLSDSEIKLCNEMRILPAHYLSMLQTMSMEMTKGNVTNKSDAHGLFKVDPNKVDRVYDVLVEKGFAHS